MVLQIKSLTIEDMTDAGIGLARLAILSAVDKDGDTYEPGAFSWKPGGVQWAPMIGAHNRGMMPFGKAKVFEREDQALAEINLNLATHTGLEWHKALMFDLEKGEPVQEWSYGYEVLDAEQTFRGRATVRSIKQTDVHEVSPVIRGAGVGARTLAIKSAELKEQHFAPLIASLADLESAIGDDPAQLSATGIKQLEEIEAGLGKALARLKSGAASCTCCQGAFDPKDLDDGQCSACLAAIADGKAATDTALAAYLMHQSRRHLPG